MGTLKIQIDDKLERDLERLGKCLGCPKSEIALDALRWYLAIRKFRQLRRKAMPDAAAAGYLIDADVFRDMS
jgi:predicted transcriptional regulator